MTAVSIYETRVLLIYACCVAALLGAAMGSFLNCASWRIAHGESFLKGRSRCPSCGHALGALDLIPVFSWLLLRGRCRWCREKISPRYLVTELLFAALTVGCLLRFDLTVICLRNWIFLCCLFCLSLVDLESFTIPDGCLWIALGAWVLALPLMGTPLREIGMHLLAGLVFGGGLLLLSLLLDKVLGKESLGGGDIKLYGVVGLYLGLAATLFSLMAACLFGLLFGALRRRFGGKQGEQIPFGPSIAASAALMLFFGDGLVSWYLSLL
ncbi:MAG: prepilin peptidase [Oscillospiraceae bacterium]|nr:prepilin peptidase [Oscillospiraceae bacterium]